MTGHSFVFDGFRGEASEALVGSDPAAAARRLLDPTAAEATLHWGRNYLYRSSLATSDETIAVVVKQFRESGWRARWRRHRVGSKGARSWRTARALVAAGIATPEPLFYAESERPGGPSFYVCRFLPDRLEARYLLRARQAGDDAERFPEIEFDAFLGATADLARRLHEADIWFRDFSAGNLLLKPGATPREPPAIELVDLNRCRAGRRLTLGQRMRDLARLQLVRDGDRIRLLSAYFGGMPPARAHTLYEVARRSFHGRHRWKNMLRGAWARLKSWLVPRGAHPHIPAPPEGAASRDKIVWDRLSDQPHSHAGRLERAAVRFADLGDHARSAAALVGALPRIRRAYRGLVATRNRTSFAWPGLGVALRPWPADPERLLTEMDALGARQALVRLHPWEDDHGAEEELARALAERGVEVAFALPQSRELVKDPSRWRSAIEEIASRFTPYGRHFQIGQAINRSKWGIWSYGEYLELAGGAAEILRRHPGVELLGPAVIDFEAHATAAVVNRHHASLRFDALASLLYVDRRGAPENRQLGYDTIDKVTLLAAIAETSRLIGRRRHWITEFNWPLREGPHSPAGQRVSVDEATQADYLVRYAALALGSGYVERLFWWQLVARGYGLVDPERDGTFRRRPAHAALATLERELGGTICLGPVAIAAPLRRYAFRRPDGGETHLLWSTGETVRLPSEAPPQAVVSRDGTALSAASAGRIEVGPAPVYWRFEAGSRTPTTVLGTKRA